MLVGVKIEDVKPTSSSSELVSKAEIGNLRQTQASNIAFFKTRQQ